MKPTPMEPERWQQVETLYLAALGREADERAAFLAEACAEDEALRREVESLLRFHERADNFIEAPALEVAAQLEAESQNHSLVGRQIGPYQFLSLLGAGGMGEVYRALDSRLDREVAIKVLHPHLAQDMEALARFKREARAVAALSHPNILAIHDFGTEHGVSHVVMELLEGETLRNRLRNSALPWRKVVEIGIAIADGLAAAHAKGITHRDLKPENIFLTTHDQVKILDFGIARIKRSDEDQRASQGLTLSRTTAPGRVIGTVGYMSPEQLRGEEVDAPSDIFSFGCVLYEMMSGRRAFEHPSAAETTAAILKDEPPELAEPVATIPHELVRLIRRCLKKNPEKRFHSARDLAFALRAILIGAGASIPDSARAALLQTGEISPSRPTASIERPVTVINRRRTRAVIALGLVPIAVAALYYSSMRDRAIDSVAVLPFVNVGADANTEYLADGITETLINDLSQAPKLTVIARSSVFSYKARNLQAGGLDPQAAARALRVQAVLVGRVLRRGDELLISAELVDARDNSLIWTDKYNRKITDIFAVQEAIARDISRKLRLKLTGEERPEGVRRYTDNIRAFQYYMEGRSYIHRRTREALLTAAELYEKAIAEDRNYALAYAGLADACMNLAVRGYIAPGEGRGKSEMAARMAVLLDENLAEAHVAKAISYMGFAPFNFPEGDRELRRAIELSPSLAWAHMYLGLSLMRQGRLDEGLVEMLKARELDPLSLITARQVSLHYNLKRDPVSALQVLKQANELGPAFTSTNEIGIYIQNRLYDEALAELEKAKRERKNDPILIYSTGMVRAAQGKRSEALAIIKELERLSGASLNSAHYIAKIYSSLNDKDLAFNWLERGLASSAIGAFYKDEPSWDSIRSDPRFANLLGRMGVPH